MLARGSHVERPEIAAAEGAHRGTLRGERELRKHCARGGKAEHLAAAIERDPVAAVAVDRRAVGPVRLGVEAREHARTRRRAGRRIVVVGVNRARGRIGVIHRAAVGAPREAVADRHAAQHALHPSAGVDAQQLAGRRVAALVHRAREKTALRIATSVVEAVVSRIIGRIGELLHQHAVGAREPDPVAQRDHEAAGRAEREAADRFGHRHRQVGAGGGVEAVERRRIDVDPVERVLVGRPHRALAEARLRIERAGERRTSGGSGRGHGGRRYGRCIVLENCCEGRTRRRVSRATSGDSREAPARDPPASTCPSRPQSTSIRSRRSARPSRA